MSKEKYLQIDIIAQNPTKYNHNFIIQCRNRSNSTSDCNDSSDDSSGDE